MKNWKTRLIALSLALAPLGLVACESNNWFEEAGEDLDEAAEEVEDEVDDAF